MKAMIKGLGIAVFAAMLVFALAGCKNDEESSSSSTVVPANGVAASDKVIDIYDIQGVTVPVTGETPVKTISENEQYSGTVKWSKSVTWDEPEELIVTSTFAAGTRYTATITLTAKAGYTLQGAYDCFTVAGATSVGSNYLYSPGVIYAGFPETAAATLSPEQIEYYWVDQHGNLATTSGGATAVKVGDTLTITAQSAGYTVKQWYLNGVNTGLNGNTYSFSSSTIGNHIVSLVVEKNGKVYNTNITIAVRTPVTVTFDANGGSGSTPSQSVLSGSNITLPDGSGLSKSGYIFGGWNTDSSGTGTNYSAGSSYTVPSSNITLYAKWGIPVTVTFNINGGSGTTPASITNTPDSNITLPGGSGFSRSNYNFGGWNTNSSGTGTNYSAGSSYTVPSSSITLYANWVTQLGRVSGLGVKKTSGSYEVTWNALSGATSYKVYYSIDGTKWDLLGTTKETKFNFNNKPSQGYCWIEVAAVNSAGVEGLRERYFYNYSY